MQKTVTKMKESKSCEASKELMSKLYFSRTQQNCLKMYGNSQDYVQELGELMAKTCKKKLIKIIEKVKQNNLGFKKYLEKKHIQKLAIEDVSSFEEALETQNKKLLNSSSLKVDNSIKQLNNEIIRIGFMMILEKLKNEKLNNVINETKYIQQMLQKDNSNLEKLGYEYLGIESLCNLRNISQDIASQQKENGSFKLINSKIREQASTIYEVQNYLNSITMK